MKRTKRAYDPARPNFKHIEKEGDEESTAVESSIREFVTNLTKFSSRYARMHFKESESRSNEYFCMLEGKSLDGLRRLILETSDVCANLFFQPFPIDPLNVNDKTWFGWADTGSVHPSVYRPHPIAFWETSPGNFQAVWKWERGLPIAASTARVEALLHEFGGKLGSHLPDAYLRVPGVPNFSTYHDQWPVVRLRYNAFPIEEACEQALIDAEDLYMTE
jgi:RepB DNA-primase from phage plasmid